MTGSQSARGAAEERSGTASRPNTARGGVGGEWDADKFAVPGSRPGTGGSRVRDRLIEARQFSESAEFGQGELAGLL